MILCSRFGTFFFFFFAQGRRSSKCSVLRMSYQFSNLPEPGCKNAGQAEPDSLIQGKSRRDQILGSFGWRVYVLCSEFRVQVVIGLTANSPSLAALGKWPEYTPQYAPLQTINVPLGDHRRNLRNTVTSRDPVGFTACDPPRTASKRPTARLYQMTLFLALSSSLSLFLSILSILGVITVDTPPGARWRHSSFHSVLCFESLCPFLVHRKNIYPAV